MSRMYLGVVATVTVISLCACVSEPTGNNFHDLRTYKLGNRGQVVLRAPVASGIDPAEYSVVFDKEELRQFLAVDHLPLSDKAIALLDKESCKLGIGHKSFSIGIDGAIDHTVRDMEKRQLAKGYYWQSDSPTIRYGFLDKGEPKWLGTKREAVHDLFVTDKNRPYGMIIRCGYNSDKSQLGNCLVSRDVNKVVSIQYMICPDLMSEIKEIDNLYFDLLQKIVITPKLTSDYRYNTRLR